MRATVAALAEAGADGTRGRQRSFCSATSRPRTSPLWPFPIEALERRRLAACGDPTSARFASAAVPLEDGQSVVVP